MAISRPARRWMLALWPRGPRRARRDDGRTDTRVEAPRAPPGPAGGPELASQEWARVREGGTFGQGDTAWVVIVASFTPEQLGRAREILRSVRSKGYRVGLGNSAVYPELRDGYVALVAGPYATREGAEDQLEDLRQDAAPDAFVKRVTLRKP